MTKSAARSTRTAATVLVDQAVVSGVNFLTTVLLVRELGLSGFGVFSLVWLFVLLAVGLEQALVAQPLLTIGPKTEGPARAPYLGAVLVLQGIYTLLCGVAVVVAYGFVLTHWDGEVLAGTFLPVVLVVLAKQAHAFVRSSFFVRGARRAALANDMLAYLGQLAGLGVLWTTGHLDLVHALWVIAAGSSLATLVALTRHREWRTTGPALAEAAKRHWHFSRWLAAMQAAQFFASNSFLVAAGALLGAGAVGAIKAAHSVVGVLHLVFLAMENVAPISAARHYVAEGMAGLVRYIGRLGAVGLGATLIISATLVLFPLVVLQPLYEEAVSHEIVLALRALSLLYVFAFAISVLQIAFRTMEHTRPVFLAYMVNTAVAVLVAEPVVEHFGFLGAVLGMAGQQALMALLLLVTFLVIVARRTAASRHEPAAHLPAEIPTSLTARTIET